MTRFMPEGDNGGGSTMKHRSWAALAVAVATMISPNVAFAQKGDNAPAQIVFRVCNNTSNDALVAISYQPVNDTRFNNEGWFTVNARACEDLVTSGNAYMYGYAEVRNNNAVYWSGDHPLCVQYPGPYAFWSIGTTCAPNQQIRNFVVLHADSEGVYTWTLDP